MSNSLISSRQGNAEFHSATVALPWLSTVFVGSAILNYYFIIVYKTATTKNPTANVSQPQIPTLKSIIEIWLILTIFGSPKSSVHFNRKSFISGVMSNEVRLGPIKYSVKTSCSHLSLWYFLRYPLKTKRLQIQATRMNAVSTIKKQKVAKYNMPSVISVAERHSHGAQKKRIATNEMFNDDYAKSTVARLFANPWR